VEALLEVHWFKWTYFHERELLYLQRCSQGHGAANAVSRGEQQLLAATGMYRAAT